MASGPTCRWSRARDCSVASRSVSGRRATVLLLTDRDSGVSVRDVQSGTQAVLNGNPDDRDADARLVEANADVKLGDELVTVGSATVRTRPTFPSAKSSAFVSVRVTSPTRVTIRLFADAATTEFVRILRWPVP